MFSIVIPVYKNEASIPELLEVLRAVAAGEDELEVVFVVDGSPDRCFEELQLRLRSVPFRAQLLSLSRNFGSFAAITAGLRVASGDLFAVISADLQDPPEVLADFRRELATGRYDVVVGTRRHRDDPAITRLGSRLFWTAYRVLGQPQMPRGGVDLFACNRRFRAHLLDLHERNSSLVGLVFWLGFRRGEIQYDRRKRPYGRSAWTFARRLRYLLDSAFAFSDLPIRLLSFGGIVGLALSAALFLIVLYARLTGRIEVPGYSATVLAVVFFGGLNALGLGLIGEYVWRTFENTKGRPSSVVMWHETFPAASDEP